MKRQRVNTRKESTKAELNFDLNQQEVAVVIGDKMREKEIRRLIIKHNGQARVIDAFYKQSNLIEHFSNELAHSEIVIMVQNYCKHATSKALRKIIADTNKKFGISNSAGLQSIEQAIYRADKGIKAYENSATTIDYPTK